MLLLSATLVPGTRIQGSSQNSHLLLLYDYYYYYCIIIFSILLAEYK